MSVLRPLCLVSSQHTSDTQLHPVYPKRYPGTNLHPEYGADTWLRPRHPERYPGTNLHPEYRTDAQLCLVNQELSAGSQLHLELVISTLVTSQPLAGCQPVA